MFSNTDLNNHFKTASTIKNQALVLAEWNLNTSDNIDVIGNYRYRWDGEEKYKTISMVFSKENKDTPTKYYWGATDFDILVNGGLDENQEPLVFTKGYDRIKGIYSLEECFNRFRPRSGINKVLWLNEKTSFFPIYDEYLFDRPRFYVGSRDDKFKYWTSYRQESVTKDGKPVAQTFGLSENKKVTGSTGYRIADAAPFVKYKTAVPTNKIVVKIQTGTGTGSGEPKTFTSPLSKRSNIPDPFYADSENRQNMKIPSTWKIQGLFGSTWKDLLSDDIENTPLLLDNTVVDNDGYLEIIYGLKVPGKFRNNFKIAETFSSESALPEASITGYAYLVKDDSDSRGIFYVWDETEYYEFEPAYAWRVGTQEVLADSQYVTDLTSPDSFVDGDDTVYREFQLLDGIRVFVSEMNRPGTPFELIELSPRLSADITDKVTEFTMNKIASDIGNSGLPVGQLLVSNGNISIFDFDQAFNSNNPNSIVRNFMSKNLQIKFYEAILDVNGADYYIPVKTMYADGFQDSSSTDRTLSIELRDMFLYFEAMIAPQIVLNDVSLSVAISMLLDSIGFSNFSFKKLPNEKEMIIPNFFIAPNTTIAQVLNDLAVSSQSAMFFDEYNNFTVMSKDYMMPKSVSDRATDFVLVGSESEDQPGALANIVDIANKNSEIYNDGKITYFTRYLQRSVSSLSQASKLDEDRIYGYKPVLLWEVSPTENVKSQNDVSETQSAYVLTAIPLNDTLSESLPEVKEGKVVNNVINLGSATYWISRYNGYFYANGEIIRFDAVKYSIYTPAKIDINGNKITISKTTDVWISSAEEYQNYFSKLAFGGKIYPQGEIRIYSEPYYDTESVSGLKEGAVAKHGRGQFGTSVRKHNAGVDEYYLKSDYHRTFKMKSDFLFKSTSNIPATTLGATGKLAEPLNLKARGFIANFLSSNPEQENSLTRKSTDTGSVQSSALSIRGPYFSKSKDEPLDHVSYVYRNAAALDPNKFYSTDEFISVPEAFGTRLRIIGKSESTSESKQTADGSSQYYTKTIYKFNELTGKSEPVDVNFGGASGGMSILLDPYNNTGYYFEIIALSEDSSAFSNTDDRINNVLFYKVKKEYKATSPSNSANSIADTAPAIPELLWAGLAPIYVDSGKFTGKSRMTSEEQPSVYDLAIEYKITGEASKGKKLEKTFNLYINGNNIATVIDKDALPDVTEYERFDEDYETNPYHMALFVRGSANVMFENMYAISKKSSYYLPSTYRDGKTITVSNPVKLPNPTESKLIQDQWRDDEKSANQEQIKWAIKSSDVSVDVTNNDQFNRYTIPGPIRKSFMSSVGDSITGPEYDMWYEEFGTILREAAYFNIRYDKAYPSMYSIVSPTFNDLCGYKVSGFNQNPYGAEFMIFNITDAPLNLDSASGNYLRIQGIAFTQESQHDLTVDEYYKKRGDLSSPIFDGSRAENQEYFDKYTDIKNSRTTYGPKSFALEPKYVQTQDAANELMRYVIDLVSKKRKSVGIKMFANPALQLGDIVSIQFKTDEYEEISSSRFVIYHMTYSKTVDGPQTTIYLSEVV